MAAIKRHYHISYTVFNRLTHTISVNQTVGTVVGMINMGVIKALQEKVGQEWFLESMTEDNKGSDHTPQKDQFGLPKTDALNDYQFMITGMVMLECDEEGKPYPYIAIDE